MSLSTSLRSAPCRCPPAAAIAPLVRQARPARTGGAQWCCRSRQWPGGRGAGHACRAARVRLGRARPPGDRAHAPGRQPRRHPRRGEAAPGRGRRPRHPRPRGRPGRRRRPTAGFGARTETTLRAYLEARGEGHVLGAQRRRLGAQFRSSPGRLDQPRSRGADPAVPRTARVVDGEGWSTWMHTSQAGSFVVAVGVIQVAARSSRSV